MKTFEILQFKRALEDLQLETDENGECINTHEDLKEFVKEFAGVAEDKIKAIQHVIGTMKAEVEINKQEISCIQSTNKQIEKDIIGLNDMMGFLLDGENIKTNIGSFYYGKESLYIADEKQFKQDNPSYIKEVPTVRKELDKVAIKEEIEFLVGVKLRKGVIFRAKKAKEL